MQKKKTKQKVWTKKCASGPKCISGHIIASIPDLRNHKALDEWSKGPREPVFIPDEHELCEACLCAEVGLGHSRYDMCDRECMGPAHFDEELVIKVVRELTGK